MSITFETRQFDDFTLIYFKTGRTLKPADIRIVPPRVNLARGIVLSGRGPVWLYGYLIHYYHPAAWVATYDPRLSGAVVVASHSSFVKEGDVIKFDHPDF